MRIVITLGVAVATVFVVPVEAEAKTVEVTAGRLNVRAGPSSRRYRVIGVTSRGKRYTETGRSGNWVRINYGSRTGWLYGPYTRVVSTATKKPPAKKPSPPSGELYEVTARFNMNVRSGPSTRYRVVGRLPRDARVRVVASRGSWKQFVFRGVRRWGHASLLRKVSASRQNPPGRPDSRRVSRAGFVALKASGRGFTTYQREYRRWGTPALIYGLERVGSKWPSGRGRIQIGDIGLENGGRFAPHASHRTGKDADMRPMRKSGEGPVTYKQSAYSRAFTQDQINAMRREMNVDRIFFNDPKTTGRRYIKGHDNHLHVRVR